MIEVVKFKAEHLAGIKEQEAMAYLQPYMSEANTRAMEQGLLAFTVLSDGRAVACGGVVQHWNDRGEAWAILDEKCKKDFVAIHGAAKKLLDECPLRRIEATVDFEFRPGHRWVRALGFECEAPRMRGYQPDGRDSVLYARVK